MLYYYFFFLSYCELFLVINVFTWFNVFHFSLMINLVFILALLLPLTWLVVKLPVQWVHHLHLMLLSLSRSWPMVNIILLLPCSITICSRIQLNLVALQLQDRGDHKALGSRKTPINQIMPTGPTIKINWLCYDVRRQIVWWLLTCMVVEVDVGGTLKDIVFL